jgi:hypothetical protein
VRRKWSGESLSKRANEKKTTNLAFIAKQGKESVVQTGESLPEVQDRINKMQID